MISPTLDFLTPFGLMIENVCSIAMFPPGGIDFEPCTFRRCRGQTARFLTFRNQIKKGFGGGLLKNKKPLFAVECKTGEKSLSKSITYFCERTNIPKFYQVHRGQKHHSYSDKIQLLPFSEFCKLENLV
jgi:hypothetical protein